MLEIIPPNTNFDFVGIRKPLILLSFVLNLVALLLLVPGIALVIFTIALRRQRPRVAQAP